MPSLEGIPDPPEVQHGDGAENGGTQALEVRVPGLALVVPLVPRQSYPLDVNPDCVRFCEDLLGRATRGEINFVAAVAVTPDNAVVSGWCKCEAMRPFSVVGGLYHVMMKFDSLEIEP